MSLVFNLDINIEKSIIIIILKIIDLFLLHTFENNNNNEHSPLYLYSELQLLQLYNGTELHNTRVFEHRPN